MSHFRQHEFRSSADGITFYTDLRDKGFMSCQKFKPVFVILKNTFHVSCSLQLLFFFCFSPPLLISKPVFPQFLAVIYLGEESGPSLIPAGIGTGFKSESRKHFLYNFLPCAGGHREAAEGWGARKAVVKLCFPGSLCWS